MIRVLFLTESFHPVFGGGEQHIRELGRRLAASGDEVTVLTRRGETAWPARETLDGIQVRRVSPSGPGRRGKYLMVLPALAGLHAARGRFDVLVVRGTRVLGLPGLVMARALGRPVVMQADVNGELSGEVYTWGTRFAGGPVERAVRVAVALRNGWLRDADAFVAMSHEIEREFLAAGVARHKVARIPHGVDTERFRPASPGERSRLRRELGLPEQGELIAYTGRLLRGKGLDTLLEAFRVLAPAHPQATLLLVGSGGGQSLSVEAELRERAIASGLGERIRFTGRVDDVSRPLRAADLAVLPSHFEGLGLALIEAAACGLPGVGSRTGGIVDVIEDGASGSLVAPGDARGLADALGGLLGDPGVRAEMGRRARARALGRFDLRDSVERYRQLFRELAGRSGTTPRGAAA